MTENRLLDAVDALLKPREVPTTITGERGEWLRIERHQHPPLLVMLYTVNGSPGGSPSADPGVPIDTEAAEIITSIRGTLRSWCEALELRNDYSRLGSAIRKWYDHHTAEYLRGDIGEDAHRSVTATVRGWVRRIEAKFDPDEIREWKHACPNVILTVRDDGTADRRYCAARRINVGGFERFAIRVNVTQSRAECAACGAVWEGEASLFDLNRATIELGMLLDTGAKERNGIFIRHAAGTSLAAVEDVG